MADLQTTAQTLLAPGQGILAADESGGGNARLEGLEGTITRATHEAVADVGVDKLFVVHSGDQEFPLGEKIVALPISRISRLKAREVGVSS